jgi:hypothetical protein
MAWHTTMKSVAFLFLCLFILPGSVVVAVRPAVAQENPRISLTADNEPLGDVLDTISQDTGYRFNLDSKWQDHPVSATIGGLTLEQGLKRLLRSLNHTIIWDADRTVTIMVFGRADPARPGSAISFAEPPQVYPEAGDASVENEETLDAETDPADTESQEADTDAAGEEDPAIEPGEDESTPPASPDEIEESISSDTEPPPGTIEADE